MYADFMKHVSASPVDPLNVKLLSCVLQISFVCAVYRITSSATSVNSPLCVHAFSLLLLHIKVPVFYNGMDTQELGGIPWISCDVG